MREKAFKRDFLRFYDVMMYLYVRQSNLESKSVVEKFNNLNKGALLTVAFE